MNDHTLFGLSHQTWQFINTFAPWLSAIGTLSAVGFSLYLARSQRRPRLRVSAGKSMSISPGVQTPYLELLAIKVVNVGERSVRVTNVGWRVGTWKKRFAVQILPGPHSPLTALNSPLPVELEHGQEGTWYVPLKIKEGFSTHPLEQTYDSATRSYASAIGDTDARTRALNLLSPGGGSAAAAGNSGASNAASSVAKSAVVNAGDARAKALSLLSLDSNKSQSGANPGQLSHQAPMVASGTR